MPECGILGRRLKSGEPIAMGKAEWVIASSSSSPWHNLFQVEHHVRPAFERPELTSPAFVSLLDMKEPTLAELRLATSSARQMLQHSGDVAVVSEGTPVWVRHLGPTEAIYVSFSADLLAKAAGRFNIAAIR